MKLTQSEVAKLPLPEHRDKDDVIYFDDEVKGFGLRFRKGGKSTWLVQYRDENGATRRFRLGDGRSLDAADARRAARKYLGAVAQGGDPQAEKEGNRARAKVTLKAVADDYLVLKKPTLRPNTFNADHRYLTQHWKPLHGRPIDAITRRDVSARLRELIREHGPTAAARARGALSSVYGWAIGEGLANENPVIGTNNPIEGKEARDRVLKDHELRTIWQACRDDDFGRIIRLLVLTGARRDEIGGLRWEEIDFDRGILNIPGTRTKNHRTLTLPLPPMALDILEAAPRQEGRAFVFGGRGGAFSAWSYATLALLARIAEAHGKALEPWRIHDLRRTMRTGLGKIGVPPHIAELAINHVKGGVEAIYDRYNYQNEIGTALARWADHVRTVVEGGEQKVVPLRA